MKLDLKQLVKEATEAAKQAPDHLQEAAFNRVFEALMANQQGVGNSNHEAGSPAGMKDIKGRKQMERPAGENSLEHLDRTQHSDIRHNDLALNNSLRLLQAAKDDLGIDGLSAATIAKVLVDKFRCKVTRQAVSLALNSAGRYVNRHNQGGLVIFRIMAPGEEYLGLKSSLDSNSKISAGKRRVRNKKRSKTETLGHSKALTNKSSQKLASRTKAGPTAAMSQLYDTGFFSSGRTIVDINGKLKHNLGHTFKQNELSPLLLRWLRNGKLTRNQNSDNQYEYKQP